MSCYIIYYKDGAKMMRPVMTAAEYRNLRDTERQKATVDGVRSGNGKVKHRLMQMNYSCMPNENGSLKGAARMTMSVGMDVDLHRDDYANDEDYRKALEAIPQKVMAKKEELGLLMLERSASKGYHVVFRRKPELNQEENLRWASDLLGVEFDKGAKDITRVFFTTTASEEDLIYLDDELFELKECPAGFADHADAHEDENNRNANLSEPEEKSGKPEEPAGLENYLGIPYDKIVRKWWELYNEGQTPVKSNRDVLTFELAVNLRHICGFDRETLDKVIPCYDGFAHEQKMKCIDSALAEKRTQMPKRLKDVITELRRDMPNGKLRYANANDDHGREEDPLMDSMRQGWDPPEMPKKLPRIVWLLIKPYPEQYHPVLAVTAMLMLGAIASHYRAVYLDGRVVSPNLYAAFIAGSGKGKGWISKLCDQMCENTLQAWDEAEWQKVHDNAEMRERMKNSKECPPKYHPKLRIMETMSKTSLLEVQTNLGENGMVFCKYSESDELANSSKAAFSNLSVILRKAWNMDMHRQFYMSDASCNTQCRLNAAILLTGTPKSVLTRLFSDTENGMMQRFMPMILPKMKRQFRPPKYMGLTPEEKEELDGLLIGLWQKDLSLGDKVLTLEMPKTEKMVGEWYDALEERYNDGQVTEAEADLSHRVGQFMLRAAIPFVAMEGEESREMLELVRWLGDVSYYNICHIFGMRVAQDMKESQELMEQNFDRRKTIEPLLSRLPEVFTVKQLQEQRARDGQSPDVKMLLSRYCKNGKLVKVGKGMYKKVCS